MTTEQVLIESKAAKGQLTLLSAEKKNEALLSVADALEEGTQEILAANGQDLANAAGKINDVMMDRLRLTPERISAMAEGIREVAKLPDPVGKIIQTIDRPNGLHIEKVRVPIGVVAIIYESRPNVTSDAAALALKSGNVCVLRGGKESFLSSCAILSVMRKGLVRVGLPETFINMIPDPSRESANKLMTAVDYIDLLIPRGGAGLIRACVEQAKVPCIQTGTGICHVYVDETADFEKALNIIENAKTSRPSVCNAEEVCLVARKVAPAFLPLLRRRLVDDRIAAGKQEVELRCDPEAYGLIGGTPAGNDDFDTEFLNYILAVKVVENVGEAIEHIALHSTHHSDAIVTESKDAAALFTAAVDSAAVYVNASTRFTDGGEFGLGCEIGISTQKLHARGPMGIEELTTYKYIVCGNGQIR